jgi:hypothetical protein
VELNSISFIKSPQFTFFIGYEGQAIVAHAACPVFSTGRLKLHNTFKMSYHGYLNKAQYETLVG